VFVLGEEFHLGLVVEIGADEGVAAFDVVAEIGEGAFGKGAEEELERLLGFAFENFEEEREFGGFDGLGVDIDAVDVGEEDAFAFADGETVVSGGDTPHPGPLPSEGRGRRGDLDDGRVFAGGPVFWIVFGVEFEVPVEEEIVSAEEKRAGAASGIQNAEFGDAGENVTGEGVTPHPGPLPSEGRGRSRFDGEAELWCRGDRDLSGLAWFGRRLLPSSPTPGSYLVDESADCVLDDVLDDVGGGVVNAAGFFDFGFFFDDGVMALGEANDFAEELFVNLAEDIGRKSGEDVWALGIVEALEDAFEEFVVDFEVERKGVGSFVAAFLGFKMEEAGVVAVVSMLEELAEAGINAVAIYECLELAVVFNAAAFADAEENDAIDDALDGKVEFALGKIGVFAGEVFGKVGAPGFDGFEEGIIDIRSSAFALGGFSIAIEGAFKNGIAREDGGDFIPFLCVFIEGEVKNPSFACVVAFVGFDAAIIDGEFFEIAEDAEREFRGPGVAAELKGWGGFRLDPDGGLFGFEKEFARAADAEAVVGSFGGFADFDGVLVDDVFVGFGVALFVIDVPAERFEERVKKFAAELCFVVLTGFVGVELLFETGDEIEDYFWCGHCDLHASVRKTERDSSLGFGEEIKSDEFRFEVRTQGCWEFFGAN
jgi:hypothetical protein